MNRQSRVWGMFFGLSLATACYEAPDGDTGPKPSVVTMFDLDRILTANPKEAALPLPGGIPFAGRFARMGSNLVAKTIPAFADGQIAAYITTEYWNQIPEIWVQPMYVLTTGRDATGKWVETANGPIFSVAPVGRDGKTSAFYSPYWQVYYVTVPATNSRVYRSVREIFADQLPMEAGEPRLCSLVPMNATVETFANATDSTVMETRHPITGTPAGSVGMGKGYVDGVEFKVFSFGKNRFTYDKNTRVVDEQPLFIPVVRDKASGGLLLSGLPTILGSRGLYQPKDGAVIGKNSPNFGSFWRLYLLQLPTGAATIIPPAENNTTDFYSYQRTVLAQSAEAIEVLPGMVPDDFSLRVLLNKDCATLLTAPQDCIWLDSQDAIEAKLPRSAIIDTGITANCPFILYKGKPVP